MKVSIVITTRNRSDDLRRALTSCYTQRGIDLEVLVYDDASTDNTSEIVSTEFPDARVVQVQERVGLIVLRNRGFREATGDYVVSIDDDAYFTSATTVRDAVEMLRENSDAAAIALPYVEPRTKDPARLISSISPGEKVRSYVGCAHLIKRDIALSMGGYREFFVHQGEERDLAIRMLEKGYGIIMGGTPPIVHDYSPKREVARMSYYGTRNTLLFAVLNLPFSAAILRLCLDSINLFRHKLTFGGIPAQCLLIGRSLVACLWFIRFRDPVSLSTYRLFRSLPRHGPYSCADYNLPDDVDVLRQQVFAEQNKSSGATVPS
ncbi:glycosyltransferase family 2 protein [Blastopirellula marina]|uniref:Glycosyltransferase 2-like domain-containing protein n=1 Tax=Blastopirellula marina TaxID=124 RepID=A0A2S8G1C9_9BACT|nr:glycosyltransferase family 2 protein [Blastopirellula marina]PQO38071.1 hypothetical protein C5Y98_08280 [Blastopirellula marina]PTL44727.1 hypothetical protein C5Y97_08280 [Blastopirellula marina]